VGHFVRFAFFTLTFSLPSPSCSHRPSRSLALLFLLFEGTRRNSPSASDVPRVRSWSSALLSFPSQCPSPRPFPLFLAGARVRHVGCRFAAIAVAVAVADENRRIEAQTFQGRLYVYLTPGPLLSTKRAISFGIAATNAAGLRQTRSFLVALARINPVGDPRGRRAAGARA
jgi:hypothetical protein